MLPSLLPNKIQRAYLPRFDNRKDRSAHGTRRTVRIPVDFKNKRQNSGHHRNATCRITIRIPKAARKARDPRMPPNPNRAKPSDRRLPPCHYTIPHNRSIRRLDSHLLHRHTTSRRIRHRNSSNYPIMRAKTRKLSLSIFPIERSASHRPNSTSYKARHIHLSLINASLNRNRSKQHNPSTPSKGPHVQILPTVNAGSANHSQYTSRIHLPLGITLNGNSSPISSPDRNIITKGVEGISTA